MKRILGRITGCAVLIALVVGVWQAQQRRLPSVTLLTGEKVRVVGFTYGRKHTIGTWRFQWAFPPVARITHNYETETDTLVLWMRRTSHRGYPCIAVVEDERGVEIAYCHTDKHSFAAKDSVYPHLLAGIRPDGERVTIRFYDGSLARPAGALTLQSPRIARALQPQQPEPLPAVREVNGARVRLEKVEWGCSRVLRSRWHIQPMARPHLQVEPAHGWVPLRAVVAPVGAGYHEPYNYSSPRAVSLVGSLHLPVYQLVVWFKNRSSGRTEPVKFFIEPPPIEQFRKRRQYVDQISAAIVHADYGNALALCERAQSEFPDLAAFYRGYALALSGDYARAIQAWQRLGKPRFEDPWRYDARPAMALCHLLLGDSSAAQAIARAWRADWNLAERVARLESEINLSAASSVTAISESEVRQALTLLNPKHDPKNPDDQRRFRAAHAIAEHRYRDALHELKSLQIKRLINMQDRLLMAYLFAQRSEVQNARPLLRQVEDELSAAQYPEWWNLRLLGRILFRDGWRL